MRRFLPILRKRQVKITLNLIVEASVLRPFRGANILATAFTAFFSENGFMPHGHCYLWNPLLVNTMLWSDLLIGLAYVSISLSLYALIRKIKLPFSAVFIAFGLFIGACGATHFMEIITLWHPIYWIAAVVKVITAIASVFTAALLFPIAPKIIRLSETAKLANQHRLNLEKTNRELELKTEELAKINGILADQQKVLAHSAKMSALGEMAGGIAHEINSPLGIITVHANQLQRMLKRDLLTPEMILKESNLIASTALRIGDIIKGLRAFAREGENDPFEWTSVSVIVNDALILCQTKFVTHGIDLKVDAISPELTLECRAVQLGQVILNLLNNAYDAVSDLDEKWVRISTRQEGEWIIISVIDSGHGIPEEILHKLMQPFFTTKELGKGTGLGLSISKGIAEAHQGALQVDTEDAHTRFSLRLPRTHVETNS
jgi:signal transduction histidine kinase